MYAYLLKKKIEPRLPVVYKFARNVLMAILYWDLPLRLKDYFLANVGRIRCEDRILDDGGHGKRAVPLEYPCRTTGKI
jgi:hypothetical protein